MAACLPALLQILLVVLLRTPEALRRFYLGHNPPRLESLLVRKLLNLAQRLGLLLWRVEEDGRPVLRAPVRSLPVQRGRVVQREERVQQLLKTHLRRIKVQLHHLRVPGLVRAHVLVAGPLQLAALVAHRPRRHALDGRKRRLHAPETSCSECCLLHAHTLSDALNPSTVTNSGHRPFRIVVVYLSLLRLIMSCHPERSVLQRSRRT